MRRIKLTRYEKSIEDALIRGEYKEASKAEYEEMARTLAAYRKDAVLNIRINSQDLTNIKAKAKKLGVKYQSFIAEILKRVAREF